MQDKQEKRFYVYEKGDPHLHPGEEAKILAGVYDQDGPARGEFGIFWRSIEGQPHAILDVFQESWPMFASVPEVQRELGALPRTGSSVREVAAALTRAGFNEREHDYQRERREKAMRTITKQQHYGRQRRGRDSEIDRDR
jgi:hypothetical protein